MRKQFALALLGAATFLPALAMPAAASGGNHDRDGAYLALGDSVPFGYSPLIVAAGQAGDPKNFVGYPEIAAKTLELRDVNAACPGETSFGFISLTGLDNGCRPFRALFPLHVEYDKAQLDYAIHFLTTHDRVRLVTMMIGANDLFKLQSGCNFVVSCEVAGLPATLAAVDANVRFIFGQVRNVAHYTGDLVTLTYYATSADPLVVLAVSLLNSHLAAATAAYNGRVADGFGAFQVASAPFAGSPCAAGLLIVTSPGVCDVHPSPKGRDLLAGAIVSTVPDLVQETGQH
jgi:lysophospholipase L1-like esterase